jgi:purine-binding chemotaxis protein CheW
MKEAMDWAAEESKRTIAGERQQRIEAVWRERAHRLSQRSGTSGSEQDVKVMVLGIGKERYGIDLPDVAEVLPAVRPTPVPGTRALFAGVINVHGEIRPVIDLRRWLGMEPARSGDRARVILLRKDGREIGLQIDSVEQIRSIGSGDLQSAGNRDRGLSQHIKGSTKDLLMLLSTEALFAELDTGVTI